MTTTTLKFQTTTPSVIIEHGLIHIGVVVIIEAVVIGGIIVLVTHLWARSQRPRQTR